MSQVACHHLKAGPRVRFHFQGAHGCQLSRGSQWERQGLVPFHVASPQGCLSVLTSRWLASQSENFKEPGRSCNAFMIQPWKSCHQFSSVAQSCLTLCDPMDCSMPRLLVNPPTPRIYSNSCPLSPWCHPTILSSIAHFSSLFQSFLHQGLFKWVSSLHQVAKVLEFHPNSNEDTMKTFFFTWWRHFHWLFSVLYF